LLCPAKYALGECWSPEGSKDLIQGSWGATELHRFRNFRKGGASACVPLYPFATRETSSKFCVTSWSTAKYSIESRNISWIAGVGFFAIIMFAVHGLRCFHLSQIHNQRTVCLTHEQRTPPTIFLAALGHSLLVPRASVVGCSSTSGLQAASNPKDITIAHPTFL
jgi:hypothetical protein